MPSMRSAAVLAMLAPLAAQAPQFGVQSRLVLVPASVSDSQGQPLDGLAAEDFIVLDNGRPQTVSVDIIATGVAPIALVVAIQTTGISKVGLEKLRKVGGLIQPLVTGEHGCAAVLTFSDRINWLHECTNESTALERAFGALHTDAEKKGRMLDAVNESMRYLQKFPNSQKVLFLISESRDRGSERSLQEIVISAQAFGVTVYTATYSAFRTALTSTSSAIADPKMKPPPKTPSEETGTLSGGPPHCGPYGCPDPPLPLAEQRVDILGGIGELMRMHRKNDAQLLVAATGGLALPFTTQRALEQAIEKLGGDLNTRYLLSFNPDDRQPGYHALEVSVRNQNAHVRARPGYWSARPAQPE